jgi:L-serine dehydratase
VHSYAKFSKNKFTCISLEGFLVAISVFDLFKIGIGPSSSHTVGPMRAAKQFVTELTNTQNLLLTHRVVCHLHGSLGSTGKGHASDQAVILGLLGNEPESVDINSIAEVLNTIRSMNSIHLMGIHEIKFNEFQDLLFITKPLPFHPNGLKFEAFDKNQNLIATSIYYSVGGGFVVKDEKCIASEKQKEITPEGDLLPYPFDSANELLAMTASNGLSISQIMRLNESHWRSNDDIDKELLKIWDTMKSCVIAGMNKEGQLPGKFKVKRRAKALFQQLSSNQSSEFKDPLEVMDWVNLFALSVSEENASGGRVVTAPTNGAAGVIPAVLHYYIRFYPDAKEQSVIDFFLTAAAIGILYKRNASISGAEVGCQGEVGVACSMAAAGLCAVMGGTPQQIENAAEIGMEHHLGLTCDPVGGLVQIPCIERNAIASVKAINAARLALKGDGSHFVSLDKVIKTMRDTGADMKTKYKETARGGLAVNIVEC